MTAFNAQSLLRSIGIGETYRRLTADGRKCGHDPIQYGSCGECWNANVRELCFDLALLDVRLGKGVGVVQ